MSTPKNQQNESTNLGRLQPKGCHLYLRYDRSGRAYLTQSNSGSMKGHVAGL
ncbi:hypothetical protein HanPSC8_Chr17g0782141 [Helianthus annuus]|nr:hypothetical protein HanPSC8_Chr17g0782141 [Helianthus annuus]